MRDILYNERMTIPDAVQTLERELREILGSRLQSLVIYGQRSSGHADEGRAGHDTYGAHHPTRTLIVADSINADDLRACALRVEGWHAAGLATPLFFAAHEFERSLDVFPLEFGAILADHHLVA